ncbi:hypothetical protein POF51_25775 [Brevibacillus sp. AG]|uniref:hypothetical protein n=1 Tax=Brevibacillus sp. AG TaxID=3020891 RepID=UPI00232BEE2D|nr:hypothetical protein [Brevibacillus sp. AG]MDC0764132.1 hypothetical protein [Brevibacillus sp. AG]
MKSIIIQEQESWGEVDLQFTVSYLFSDDMQHNNLGRIKPIASGHFSIRKKGEDRYQECTLIKEFPNSEHITTQVNAQLLERFIRSDNQEFDVPIELVLSLQFKTWGKLRTTLQGN